MSPQPQNRARDSGQRQAGRFDEDLYRGPHRQAQLVKRGRHSSGKKVSHSPAQLFSPFGEIENIEVPLDRNSNRSKGFAYVLYKRAKDAKQAIREMNNYTLMERTIKVSVAEGGGKNSQAYSNANEISAADFDEESGAHYIHSAQSRALLMQKLIRDNNGK